MEFLLQNPMIFLALVIGMLVLSAYFIAKPNNNKKGSDKKVEDKDVEKGSLTDVEEVVKTEDFIQGKSKKKKIRRLKPEITRVYEKKQLKSKVEKIDEANDKEVEEEELLKKMQFVKTSKGVSKLKPYDENKEIMLDEPNDKLVDEIIGEVQKVEDISSTHFDRTRRLSKMIQDGTLDDMFCSHISEKYMNMNDIEKHIRNCSEIREKLFHRAADTIANSSSKFSISEEGKIKEPLTGISKRDWLEQRRQEELQKILITGDESKQDLDNDYDYESIVKGDAGINLRTILVVDSILKRKGKKS